MRDRDGRHLGACRSVKAAESYFRRDRTISVVERCCQVKEHGGCGLFIGFSNLQVLLAFTREI